MLKTSLLCLLLAAGYARAELTEGCEEFTACLRRAEEALESCSEHEVDEDLAKDLLPAHRRDDADCRAEIKAIQARKQLLRREKDAEFKQCLERRAGEAVGVAEMGRGKQRQCAAAREDARNWRTKRDARGSGRWSRAERRARKQARRELRSKRRELRECRREARQLAKSCKPLAQCCSEAPVCHLDYELSATHDAVKKAQRDLILQRRSCRRDSDDLDVVNADQIVDNQI